MAVGLPSTHQGCVEVDWLETVEAKSSAAIRIWVVGGNGVDQTTHFPHHRHGAITHRIQLTNAAGLEATRHQERIAAGVDQTREIIVVGQKNSAFTRIAGGQLPKAGFKATIARSQHHDLRVGVGEQAVGDLQKEINTFLIHQTGHHPEQECVIAHLQPHSLLKHLFANRLAGEVCGAVVRGERLIGGGIPRLEINAVQNAAQFARHKIEQAIEIFTVFSGADLLGVGGRYRIHPIRIDQGSGHGVIPLHVPRAPGDPIQLPAPWTLVFEVMDRKNGADLWVLMHPDRNHAGVPVVAMQHLGLPHVP